ncbi:MAG: endonuclease/exonuclease/phosphatase family protein [Chlorobium sp.]|uniref:endonuclease/exonuclease/phosphatase family protein n=1 Tax=Chlorobium sp. TaxID=1095 RepID=UPI0025C0CB67|nr:endonuclease/exonuclease/phosphatase family protein [Chlorobium sp.]MCF8215969.1 endonuclease/exonuclease/phosphatase family protein [Chlorobium sp.]MCF8270478.1 endonuclease/exonuclease/phosphatase family protein [Chlorobium sp.]MCF8287244.1 endonuclease/exonuclease/phosphatase family protein [Chlorobium sp.]MCF8290446.1 endonuclease/exonuclease/phosphatase family protein [Chlorobium sp.]MCF8384680.1 endonuclease/exonuclease/phosphatase family protein [Chlorobium sp.]
MKKTLLLVLLFFEVLPHQRPGLHAEEKQGRELAILWWNVENLFDTIDNPATEDNEFTPAGKRQWTEKKLALKRIRIRRVLETLKVDPDVDRYPDIIAFAETENRKVFVGSLKNITGISYRTVYYESPDTRGIDIGLAYNPKSVGLRASKAYHVPIVNDKPTRHIIAAGFSAGRHPFHLILNHWPSRAFDREWSEQKRIAAAKVVRHIADSLRTVDLSADIIVMGDFNDEPHDRSVRDVLGSSGDRKKVLKECRELFYNCWSDYEGIGSYWYRNKWERIDQILISCGMLQPKGLSAAPNAFRCYHFPDMLTRSSGKPYQTYYRGQYKGGYSDHLPLLLRVSVEQ